MLPTPLLPLTCAALLSLLLALTSTDAVQPTPPTPPDAAPLIRVEHIPGFDATSQFAVCIVWSDGYYAYSTSGDSPDGAFAVVTGTLTQSALDQCKRQLGEHPLFDSPRLQYLVPDAGSMQVTVTIDGASTTASWDTLVRPCWGANTLASDEYRRFVQLWYDSSVQLCAILSSGADQTTRSSDAAAVIIRDTAFGPAGDSLFSCSALSAGNPVH